MKWGIAPGAPEHSLYESEARFNLWHGPIRSSKTTHSLMRWLEFVVTAPTGGLLFMFGKTVDTLERNILRPLSDATGGGFWYSKGQGLAAWGGREIELIGANDDRAETRIRGVTAAGGYGDEITLTPEGFLKQFLGRMSLRGAKLFGATNPDGPYHRLKVDFIDRAEILGSERFLDFTWPIEANTFLDPAYIADIKAEFGEGTLFYKRFILGLWVAAEGAVYDMWTEAKHRLIRDPEASGVRADYYAVALDYGTQNPFSAGLYACREKAFALEPFKNLRVWRKRGYYYDGRAASKSKTDGDYARELLEWLGEDAARVRYIIVDPSASSFIEELSRTLKRAHKGHIGVMNADNSVLDGIRTQARLLQSGAYRVGPDASNAQCVRDYGAYLWDPKAQARSEDKPLKKNDHTKDEERYLLHTLFSGALELSKEDESALTGW